MREWWFGPSGSPEHRARPLTLVPKGLAHGAPSRSQFELFARLLPEKRVRFSTFRVVEEMSKREARLMKTYSNTAGPKEEQPPSFGLRSFLFVIFLAFIFSLLAFSMVRHRFCEGRRTHQLTPQTPIPIGPPQH